MSLLEIVVLLDVVIILALGRVLHEIRKSNK